MRLFFVQELIYIFILKNIFLVLFSGFTHLPLA